MFESYRLYFMQRQRFFSVAQKKTKVVSYAEKTMDLVFLGCKIHCVHWLTSKRRQPKLSVLCRLAEAVSKGYQEQTPRKNNERGFVSSVQCSRKQILFFNRYCAWLWLWTRWSHNSFSWFPYHLYPNMKTTWRGTTIVLWRHIYCWWYLLSTGWAVFFKLSDVNLLKEK